MMLDLFKDVSFVSHRLQDAAMQRVAVKLLRKILAVGTVRGIEVDHVLLYWL